MLSVMKGGAFTGSAPSEGPPFGPQGHGDQAAQHPLAPAPSALWWVPGQGICPAPLPSSLITAGGLTHPPVFHGAEDSGGRPWTS